MHEIVLNSISMATVPLASKWKPFREGTLGNCAETTGIIGIVLSKPGHMRSSPPISAALNLCGKVLFYFIFFNFVVCFARGES